MKTIITSSGSELSAQFDKRFGRSAWYCIYNEDTGESKFINNNNIDLSEGVAQEAVEKAIEFGVQKVISGDFGVNAQDLLKRADIQMVVVKNDNFTVRDIIAMIK
jgi:predicted Fe-Mo cluster-binding NifX family protein